jgi:hypothetical protein
MKTNCKYYPDPIPNEEAASSLSQSELLAKIGDRLNKKVKAVYEGEGSVEYKGGLIDAYSACLRAIWYADPNQITLPANSPVLASEERGS